MLFVLTFLWDLWWKQQHSSVLNTSGSIHGFLSFSKTHCWSLLSWNSALAPFLVPWGHLFVNIINLSSRKQNTATWVWMEFWQMFLWWNHLKAEFPSFTTDFLRLSKPQMQQYLTPMQWNMLHTRNSADISPNLLCLGLFLNQLIQNWPPTVSWERVENKWNE